jgi:hypothetical protein
MGNHKNPTFIRDNVRGTSEREVLPEAVPTFRMEFFSRRQQERDYELRERITLNWIQVMWVAGL